MSKKTFSVVPIRRGVLSPLSILYSAAVLAAYPYLATGRVLVHFRTDESDVSPLTTLDTSVSAGDVTRVTNGDGTFTLTLNLSATKSNLIPEPGVYFDIVAYNGSVPNYIPGKWKWPVTTPITRTV